MCGLETPPVIVGDGARHPLAVLNEPLVWLVRAYQLVLSPVLGRQCRFFPTCSAYAVAALRHHAPWRAWWLVVSRLARCQPLCAGGYDPVPGVERGARRSAGPTGENGPM